MDMPAASSEMAKLSIESVLLLLLLQLLLGAVSVVECRTVSKCPGSPDAIAALQSNANVTISRIPGIGYGFLGRSGVALPYVGGPNVTRGLVLLPEDGVAPEAYAPLARGVALTGRYVVVLEKASEGRTLRAMKQQWQLQYWVLAGHGRGGKLAAELARTLQPKVKGLVLLAAPLQVDTVNLNVFVTVFYGQKDTVVTPKAVEASFPLIPGDSSITLFPNLSHYDFASSECVGNGKGQDKNQGLTDQDFETIVSVTSTTVALSQWAVASEKALSFSDNYFLTPGHNSSKLYPGDIRVQSTQGVIPNTYPQRSWWVFTPTKIKGGFVYYPGAAVDARAYFPLAFEIAARGHLVVIVQVPSRTAILSYQDANTVIASTDPLFSGVPKGKWALGGHSAGGFATTLYASQFGSRIYAVVMHAGGWGANLTQNALPVANIYGTLDDLSPGGYDRYRYFYTDPPPKGFGPLVNLKTTKFIPIEGANHYQVGDYGYQSPDAVATISLEQQVALFASETVSFLDGVAQGKIVLHKRWNPSIPNNKGPN